ncbi:hypothetical protein V9W40_30565, partial [Klebsiella pneumoniae]|uniref:hypothetical protein n=1 Tax=Klebsiella pneumoniae TaxID=573 RepID=UPI00307FC3F5
CCAKPAGLTPEPLLTVFIAIPSALFAVSGFTITFCYRHCVSAIPFYYFRHHLVINSPGCD